MTEFKAGGDVVGKGFGSIFVTRRAGEIANPQATFESIVDWMEAMIRTRNCPGLIVGLSGTDSILTFLICAEALKRVGKQDRLMGVHFGGLWPATDMTEMNANLALERSPSFRYFGRLIMPWLSGWAPKATLTIDNTPGVKDDDYMRWASLFRRALNGADARDALEPGSNYWVVGTRNATEDVLGTYSVLSTPVSVQPIIQLWKSDVLTLCRHLGVPQIAIDNSRQVDCDCGRFDLAADHIEDVDDIIRARVGLPSPPLTIDAETRVKLLTFVEEQIQDNYFKRMIPFKPTTYNGVERIGR